MSTSPKPTWQPISALPVLASLIDGTLADTQEQDQTLLAVKDKPWVIFLTHLDELVLGIIQVKVTCELCRCGRTNIAPIARFLFVR